VRTLLERLGYRLCETRDDHLCCGSAGTYSLLQPAMSRRLRTRKVQALSVDAPDLIVSANVGCQLHLAGEAAVPVQHWVELAWEAVR
jgi:glycolate oxidase iron-sulfur subunit